MMTPSGPSEHDPTTWRGSDIREDVRTGTEVRSVLERAHMTAVPYQYEDDELLTGEQLFGEFRSRGYARARVHYNCGVEANGRLKLLTQGHFWGSNDDDHQRFKAQYRRPPPPTETVPFDTYEVWMRYQYGTVDRHEAGVVAFTPDADRSGESLRSLPWGELYTPVQRRIVELELVRNPPLAKYILTERGEWAEYDAAFRHDPDAFDHAP